jgi:hypothetical protein
MTRYRRGVAVVEKKARTSFLKERRKKRLSIWAIVCETSTVQIQQNFFASFF